MTQDFSKAHGIRRKLVHIILGLTFVFLIPIIPKNTYLLSMLSLLLISLILSIYTKYWRPRLILHLLKYFDKPKDLISFPAKGAIYYLSSAFLSLLFFEKNVASASLIILAVGDPAAYFIGSHFGRYRIAFNIRKLLEGTLAGVFFGTIAASFFVPVPVAFLGATAGMIAEALDIEGLNLDDNLSIPLTVGVVMTILLRR